MTTESTQAEPSKGSAITDKLKKYLRIFLTAVVVLLFIVLYLRYFYTYSEGYRAGLLQKFSHKGFIFKTYEGEMILSSVTSTTNVAIASEKFSFSVVNKSIVRQLDTIQGQNVIVHYVQKKKPVFWRGDSEYLVDSVRIRR